MDRFFFVYFMTNEWRNVLYTGVTNSLLRRVWEHKEGQVEGFTRKYDCKQLVYYETFDDIRFAIRREKAIKGWNRSRKNELVETMNPKWIDLAADWYKSG